MKNAMDRLIEKIKETNNPTVIGLDPRYDMLPKCVREKYIEDISGACMAILEFNCNLIDAVYDIVPAIKPQIAFYEALGLEGLRVFKETCEYAKSKGMLVIADIKRGDIGTTAAGYSNAFLGETKVGEIGYAMYDVDFVTVNPYLGIDGIQPFIEDCQKYGKGIFVLVKTSNKSSGELQDLRVEGGEEIYTEVGKLVQKWGTELIGENGYSSISAVVGATYPEQLKSLRKVMPNAFLLIPGYGAQGGKAEDIALGFDANGIGGIVNASRSLIAAYKSDLWKEKYTEEQYAEATRAEALRMREELNSAIQKNN